MLECNEPHTPIIAVLGIIIIIINIIYFYPVGLGDVEWM